MTPLCRGSSAYRDPLFCRVTGGYLWYPEGNVGLVEPHGQEEGPVVVAPGAPGAPAAPQQTDGLLAALHVGQRPAGLLRHVHRAQQVGMETAAAPPSTHLPWGSHAD